LGGLSLVTILVGLSLFNVSYGVPSEFTWLHFWEKYYKDSLWTIVIYMAPVLITSIGIVYLISKRKLNRNQIYIIFVLLTVSFVSFIPGLVLKIPGGSAYYFHDLTHRIFGVLFILVMSSIFYLKKNRLMVVVLS